MNKIKKIFTTLMASVLILGNAAMPVGAVAPWNVTGDYEITFFLNPDTSVTPFVHHATLTQSGINVTGNGGFPATGGDTFHWNVTTGTQTGDSLNLTVLYDLGATGTVMNMTGTIAPNGTVAGTWTDDFGGPRSGTWSITKGVSVPRIHTPANGDIVTQSALVKVDWTDSVGSNPPFMYQYQAYSDAGYTALVFDSGMTLTNSEIPTPGTPPGDYYVRVKAQNGAATQSDWSNGAENPYKITVITDPINPFDVPEQCNQTISYNLIEGTNGNDVLNGTSGPDLILAKGGNDVVNGNGGNDCIVGGAGSDVLKGGNGADVILGGANSDSIQGENGEDMLFGEAGSDSLSGGNGEDQLSGGDGSDSLSGGNGADTLTGGNGTDAANGNLGTDTCNAESETSCEI